MSKVTVLGGCGAVGSTATKTLVSADVFSEIVIGDIDINRANELARELGLDKISVVKVDAGEPESIKEAIKGSDVVLNCIGPFYKYGPTILKAVIESGINYVDVCDDFDATEIMLGMNENAKKANVSALIGMGSSPGMANVLIRFCVDNLLGEVDSVDIYHAHGGEEVEGAAVVKHRIHSMKLGIPVFDNGEFKRVNMFDENGKAYEETTEFHDLGTYDIYLYPHPETITLPNHIKGVKRVTNRGLVLPPAYAELIKGIVSLGLTSEEPIKVRGQEVVPLEFAVSYILSKRPELTRAAGLTEPQGCLKIVIKGRNKEGKDRTYILSMFSKGYGMGRGTGIPVALGAILMEQGKITKTGVLPPEACVDPMKMIELVPKDIKAEGKGGLPIVVEKIDENGNLEKIDVESML